VGQNSRTLPDTNKVLFNRVIDGNHTNHFGSNKGGVLMEIIAGIVNDNQETDLRISGIISDKTGETDDSNT
jgi:hypothetical protein